MSVFIVAEAGVNHLGDRAKMLALCDAAKAAGADAVKFQAYNAEALMKRRGINPAAFVSNATGYDVVSLLCRSELSDADLDAIAAHCKSIGLKWFASVFDPSQIERVLSRGACALKIGHAEADWPELRQACAARWPVTTYVSSGYNDGLAKPVMCIAEYPADGHPPKIGCINASATAPVGYSSHYQNYRIPAAAALRGAEYIEAHLMLDTRGKPEPNTEYGPNTEPEAAWSLSPRNFAAMVKLIREYESWL